ncbi:MAG: tRNA (adenosine(37)-N6)-dimethylallyltransferase MiaA [Anaerolineae bacterium]|nr:tRNA (adenosine(37)-N6)-dimethylallyltransferase MiaA [Anaerolineae bacterium]
MPPAGKQHSPLIVLIGQTAVGKTALALELAQVFNGEIVSADSRLVYRGMDIGVAKPTPAEQALVRHHLLDLGPPDDTVSLARFQHLAYASINDILARGRLPLLVGGTGQYVTAVIDGWGIPEVPPNPALRRELEAFAAEHSPDALHTRLLQHDPAAAAAIHPNNVRRVVRALEVFIESGTPISELQRQTPPPYHVLQIGLARTRDDLYARIDARLACMMEGGLLAEVRGLLAAGYSRHLPAMSGLGYRQLVAHLAGECTLDEALAAIRSETRDFARRQDTWFRKYNQAAHWFEMPETAIQSIMTWVRDWLEGSDATTA